MLQEVITLTAKQSNVYTWGFQKEARHRVAVCGRRFGKTFLCMREMKRAAQLAAKWRIHPDNEIWYGAPSQKQGKRVFWQRLKRAIPRHWIDGKPNETELYIRLKSGHVLRIVGLDNYDNLRGSGLFFFIGDEWADAKPACWAEVIAPMLSTCQGHSLFIGTPKGFDHLYDAFRKGQGNTEQGWRSWHYTTAQGGNVLPEEIEAARRNLGAREFEQEYEAGFLTFAGRVIYAFVRGESVKPCPIDESLPLHIGMDFNINPMTATVWQEVGEISYQVGEIIIPTSNTDELCDEIQRKYGRNASVAHISVYPDPAGAQRRTSAQGRTDIGILKDRGFNVRAMSSHPLVRDRHNVTNARFCTAIGERRSFVDPSCVKSIEAYERLTYKEGTSEPDKDSGFDHPVDATGYYMFTRFGATAAKRLNVGFMAR
jgi:hypothetical protein